MSLFFLMMSIPFLIATYYFFTYLSINYYAVAGASPKDKIPLMLSTDNILYLIGLLIVFPIGFKLFTIGLGLERDRD